MQDRIIRLALSMGIAEFFSRRSTCGRLQVGCNAMRDGRVICTGYNGPLPESSICNEDNCDMNKPCSRSIHAEANLIAYAAKEGISLKGTTLYCTHSPCVNCAGLIIQSGIERVIYKELFRDDTGLLLLTNNNIPVTKYAE